MRTLTELITEEGLETIRHSPVLKDGTQRAIIDDWFDKLQGQLGESPEAFRGAMIALSQLSAMAVLWRDMGGDGELIASFLSSAFIVGIDSPQANAIRKMEAQPPVAP